MLQTFSTWHLSGAANEQSAVYCALVPVLFHCCHSSWSLPVYNSVRTSCLLHTATSDCLSKDLVSFGPQVRRVMARQISSYYRWIAYECSDCSGSASRFPLFAS